MGKFFEGLSTGFVIGLIVIGLLAQIVVDRAKHSVRVEAVENGHAHWKVQSDGTTVFVWGTE